ncbi:MAG: hypothetical protein AAB802_01870 [Patescibacteria group bacterium]
MKIKLTRKHFALLPFISGMLLFMQVMSVMASSTPSLSQVITDGTQTIDIVDGSGTTVGSPAFSLSALGFSFSSQTSTGTLGGSTQKIRVYNPTADATWTVSMAATSGTSAVWSGSGTSYDFNDSGTDGSDDADSDSKGGRLTVDASVSTVAGVPDDSTCSPSTGISKGSSSAFQEVATAVSSITLLTGSASATTYCRWDLTDVSLSQVVPESQPSDTYSLGMTLTIL